MKRDNLYESREIKKDMNDKNIEMREIRWDKLTIRIITEKLDEFRFTGKTKINIIDELVKKIVMSDFRWDKIESLNKKIINEIILR